MAVSPTLSSTPTSAKKTSEDSASSKLGEIIIWASDEFVSFLTYNKMNETKYQPWWWSGWDWFLSGVVPVSTEHRNFINPRETLSYKSSIKEKTANLMYNGNHVAKIILLIIFGKFHFENSLRFTF